MCMWVHAVKCANDVLTTATSINTALHVPALQHTVDMCALACCRSFSVGVHLTLFSLVPIVWS